MKTRFLLLAVLLFFSILSSAQQTKIDSLKQVVSATANDTAKIHGYFALGVEFMINSRVDSAIYYFEQAIEVAKVKGMREMEYDLSIEKINLYSAVGASSQALKEALELLKRAEKEKGDNFNESIIGVLFQLISQLYQNQKDYNNAVKYMHECIKANPGRSDASKTSVYANLGQIYKGAGNLDSALYYLQRAYELNQAIPEDHEIVYLQLRYRILDELGDIHIQKGNFDLAHSYLRTSYKTYDEIYRIDSTPGLFSSMQTDYFFAKLFEAKQQPDSVLHYAQKSLGEYNRHGLLAYSRTDLLKLIMDVYRVKGNNDSLAKYQQEYIVLNDTLNNQEKLKEVQNLTFNENLRQQELENQRIQQEQERKNNLLTAGIAVFIPLFFGIIILLRKGRVKTSVISYLSVLGILFLYEFISLLLHPIIGHITHHHPVLMIIIMVAIGMLLVPLHHKVEKWVVEKMTVQKEKNIET